VAATGTARRLVARIEALCSAPADDRVLRRRVLDLLRPAVAFDAYAWLLTDPATGVGTAPLAEVPWLAELPLQIRLKYATHVNRWTSLDGSVATLDRTTGGDRARSLVWRELLARHGVGDVASLVFRDRFGCWGFLELWRRADRGPYGRADVALLRDIADPLTTALRRRQAESFVAGAAGEEAAGPVVLLLDPDLRVRVQTEATREYLRLLVPPEHGRDPVPAGAYNVAAQLLAVEAGVDDAAPSARVHLAGGRWVTFRAARLGSDGAASLRDIAVTVERTDPRARADLFARAFGLSARERELLAHLVEGRDTGEVAGLMRVSPNTVQDHLKSVFDKAGTRSRRTLLARALGTSAGR
jgi:DNA-binding CsgD family transcriptional regulator